MGPTAIDGLLYIAEHSIYRAAPTWVSYYKLELHIAATEITDADLRYFLNYKVGLSDRINW